MPSTTLGTAALIATAWPCAFSAASRCTRRSSESFGCGCLAAARAAFIRSASAPAAAFRAATCAMSISSKEAERDRFAPAGRDLRATEIVGKPDYIALRYLAPSMDPEQEFATLQ